METLKLRKDRVALEKIKKNTLLTASDNNYEYEPFKYKIYSVSKSVDKELVGKTIIKPKNLGIEIVFNGIELTIIREEDIIATIE